MDKFIKIEEIKIVKHALGSPTFHRNHYVVDKGNGNFKMCMDMVEKGFMTKRPDSFKKDRYVFHVVDELKEIIGTNIRDVD